MADFDDDITYKNFVCNKCDDDTKNNDLCDECEVKKLKKTEQELLDKLEKTLYKKEIKLVMELVEVNLELEKYCNQ